MIMLTSPIGPKPEWQAARVSIAPKSWPLRKVSINGVSTPRARGAGPDLEDAVFVGAAAAAMSETGKGGAARPLLSSAGTTGFLPDQHAA